MGAHPPCPHRGCRAAVKSSLSALLTVRGCDTGPSRLSADYPPAATAGSRDQTHRRARSTKVLAVTSTRGPSGHATTLLLAPSSSVLWAAKQPSVLTGRLLIARRSLQVAVVPLRHCLAFPLHQALSPLGCFFVVARRFVV